MFEQRPLKEKWVLVNDECKPLKKVDYTGDHDSEDEVEHVDNEMASYLTSKPSGVGYGTNSLLEKWRKTYGNADNDYEPYDDDMYEGQEIPNNIQFICDNLNIKLNTAYPLPSDMAKNDKVSRLSRMDDDLFTYEVKVDNMDDDSEHEADNDMGYDPSDIIGDDEVELTDEESSNNMDEVAEVVRIDTNLFDFETPMCKAFKEFNYLLQIDPDLLTKDIEGFKTYEDYKDDWIYEWNKDVPWVDEKPWTNAGV
ncbi:hypothetical protein Tco_0201472 [Tanacetum coccineum]